MTQPQLVNHQLKRLIYNHKKEGMLSHTFYTQIYIKTLSCLILQRLWLSRSRRLWLSCAPNGKMVRI